MRFVRYYSNEIYKNSVVTLIIYPYCNPPDLQFADKFINIYLRVYTLKVLLIT